jgi:hypothetical protein
MTPSKIWKLRNLANQTKDNLRISNSTMMLTQSAEKKSLRAEKMILIHQETREIQTTRSQNRCLTRGNQFKIFIRQIPINKPPNHSLVLMWILLPSKKCQSSHKTQTVQSQFELQLTKQSKWISSIMQIRPHFLQ